MSTYTILASIALSISILTSGGTMYRGWRRRQRDAGAQPFVAGKEAIHEAEVALRWKDRRLTELEEREAHSAAAVRTANATIEQQNAQLTMLQAQMYQVIARNKQLEEASETAERDLRAARARIGDLETQMEDLKRKLQLGSF